MLLLYLVPQTILHFAKHLDEDKTAFNIPSGYSEYLVMALRLPNAPPVLQDIVNNILRDTPNRFVLIYLDDILVFYRNFEEHVHATWMLLQKLKQHHLAVELNKCDFHSTRH